MAMGSNQAKNTCLNIPKCQGSVLEKCSFDPFGPFFGPEGAHFQAFVELSGGGGGTMGSNVAKTICLRGCGQ